MEDAICKEFRIPLPAELASKKTRITELENAFFIASSRKYTLTQQLVNLIHQTMVLTMPTLINISEERQNDILSRMCPDYTSNPQMEQEILTFPFQEEEMKNIFGEKYPQIQQLRLDEKTLSSKIELLKTIETQYFNQLLQLTQIEKPFRQKHTHNKAYLYVVEGDLARMYSTDIFTHNTTQLELVSRADFLDPAFISLLKRDYKEDKTNIYVAVNPSSLISSNMLANYVSKQLTEKYIKAHPEKEEEIQTRTKLEQNHIKLN